LLTVSITHDDLDIPAAAASMSQRISSATTVPRPATTQSATVVRYYLSLPTNSPVDPLQKQALSTFLHYPRKERPRNFISSRSYGAAEVSVHLRSELSLDSVSCYPLAALLQRDTCSGLSACAAGRRTGGLSQQSIPPAGCGFSQRRRIGRQICPPTSKSCPGLGSARGWREASDGPPGFRYGDIAGSFALASAASICLITGCWLGS
jgi:hypothetical protein